MRTVGSNPKLQVDSVLTFIRFFAAVLRPWEPKSGIGRQFRPILWTWANLVCQAGFGCSWRGVYFLGQNSVSALCPWCPVLVETFFQCGLEPQEVLERCLALGMTLDTWGGHKAGRTGRTGSFLRCGRKEEHAQTGRSCYWDLGQFQVGQISGSSSGSLWQLLRWGGGYVDREM